MNKRFIFDEEYLKSAHYVIGTDEAGRGPGAGPVFAAAVCFTFLDNKIKKSLENLNDSKQLSECSREQLYEIITKNSIWACTQGSVEDIETSNILITSLLSMKKSIEKIAKKLQSENIIVLVDGNQKIPYLKYNQQPIIKGDSTSAAIAAASIIAKVERDRFMNELDKEYPEYFWAENKGYMTKQHIEAVDKYGLTKWHRKKFFEKHFDTSIQLSLM